MKVQGQIQVSRTTSNRPPYNYITLEIEDKVARRVVLEAKLTYQEWGEIVSQSRTEVLLDIPCPELIGTIAENKEEFVPVVGEKDVYIDDKVRGRSLKPFLIEGWRARSSDFGNHHRREDRDGQVGYRVVFFRNVTKEGVPVE